MAAGDSDQWPRPVEVLNGEGRSPFILLCEHASNHIPAEYRGLGLSPSRLASHIAWDIGASELTRRLSAMLDAPAFLATYSRLLIDLNRPLHVDAAIAAHSETTEIPGNVDVSDAERARRVERIFAPYHAQVARHLDERRLAGRRTLLITIHSFVPVYRGESRPWHAGVLFNKSHLLGNELVRSLSDDPTVNVAPNVPYIIHEDEDYAIPIHGEGRGIPAALLEIRHDGLVDGQACDTWAARLVRALKGAEHLSQEIQR